MQGVWSQCDDAIMKLLWLHWIAVPTYYTTWSWRMYLTCKVNLNYVEVNLIYVGVLAFSFKCSLLFVGNLRVYCCLIIGSSPLSKILCSHVYFLLILVKITLWAMKTVTETNRQCSKETVQDRKSKIMTGLCTH